MSGDRFTVRVAPDLAARLADAKANATGAQRQLYTCIKRCAVDFLPEHALLGHNHLSGPMRGIVFRTKAGRLRVFYTLSVAAKLVILLDVGYRKDGDKHDAYEVLKRRIRAGAYDEQFAECGHQRPDV